jgi:hypothetical protein
VSARAVGIIMGDMMPGEMVGRFHVCMPPSAEKA